MKLSDQLRAEWSLIDQPHKWTKNAYARDSKGNAVIFGAKGACSYCQRGARLTVQGHWDTLGIWAENLADNVAKLFGFSSAFYFNDHQNTTHADMRIYYETMIYIAEQCE
jgi:hypothetical protein